MSDTIEPLIGSFPMPSDDESPQSVLQPPQQGHRGESALGDERASPLSCISIPESDEQSNASDMQREDFKPRHLLSRSMGLFIGALLAGMLLFVLSHALAIVSTIQGLPPLVQPLGYAIVALLIAVILAFVGRLLWIWYRLRETPQALTERKALQAATAAERAEVKAELQRYVKSFTTAGKDHQRLFGASELDKLKVTARILIHDDSSLSTWIERFSNSFVSHLDACADQRIMSAATAAGIKTAALANPILDLLVIAYLLSQLIGDLCKIYNLKASSLGTLIIMGHAFAVLYAARHLEEASEEVAQQLAGEFPGVAGGVLSQFFRRVGEGAANGSLVYRFGHVAKSLLRPIKSKKATLA